MLAELPFPVGGLVMSFVPPPERAPVRRACRTMAAWRADAVALVLLDPGEADRLRYPRRGPRAVAAMPVDGWWRERALVVRVLGVHYEERKRTRGGEPVPLGSQTLFRATRHGTVLPEAGWAGVLALFPAARAIELPELPAPPGNGDPEPPPGIELVMPSGWLWAGRPWVRYNHVCARAGIFARDHAQTPGVVRQLNRRNLRIQQTLIPGRAHLIFRRQIHPKLKACHSVGARVRQLARRMQVRRHPLHLRQERGRQEDLAG